MMYLNYRGMGKVIEGHVLDCNKKYLEKALQHYDKQLYLKWNPEKNSGTGVWEVRRRPNEKTAVPKWELNGRIFFNLEYKELDVINHVMDVPVLNYEILKRIREMDCWNTKDYVKDLEYQEDKAKDKEYSKNREELRYQIKHHRKAMQDFQELLKSGRDPLEFLSGKW